MFGGSKEGTTVKQKTVIKQKYNVPAQNIPLPTQDIPLASTNLPLDQQIYQTPIMPTQSTTVTSMPMGTNLGATNLGTNLGRKRSSSSSSSSSSERNQNTGQMMGGINPLGQPSTLTQPTTIPTGNIQSGYGPATTFETGIASTTIPGTTSFTGTTVPLGKNLYGETGYATQSYQPQEPFPGQTVYVEKPSQKISQKTKQKFQKPII